jgi:hypothetical protein
MRSVGGRPRSSAPVLHDAPCFARVTLLRWLVRMWRCREPACPTQTFSEAQELAPPRMVLTTRAVAWATSALSNDDTRVSAGCLHAPPLDAVVGRSGSVYKAWLKAQPEGFLGRCRTRCVAAVPRLGQRDP